MSIQPTQYRCDTTGCLAVRSETNHWRAVLEPGEGIITILTWEQAIKRKVLGKSKHFCGQSHCIKYVSELMGEAKKEE